MEPIRTPIFNLSFNKCATTTVHQFFLKNGVSSRSHGSNRRVTNLAVNFYQNFTLSEYPLRNLEGYEAFSDLNYVQDDLILEANVLFWYFHKRIPDAYFIFVDRDLDSWVESRMRHGNGNFARRYMNHFGVTSENELVDIWRRQYLNVSKEITSYFSSTTSRFLRYSLADDSPTKICDFLSATYTMDASHWSFENVKQRKREVGGT